MRAGAVLMSIARARWHSLLSSTRRPVCRDAECGAAEGIDARLLPSLAQTGCTRCAYGMAFPSANDARACSIGAGVTMVHGSFTGMKIDGLCFPSLHTGEPGLAVAAAVWEGDLPGVVVQFLRAAYAVVSQ